AQARWRGAGGGGRAQAGDGRRRDKRGAGETAGVDGLRRGGGGSAAAITRGRRCADSADQAGTTRRRRWDDRPTVTRWPRTAVRRSVGLAAVGEDDERVGGDGE